MLLELLARCLEQPVYQQLRTEEQLGYLVHSGVRFDHGVVGLRLLTTHYSLLTTHYSLLTTHYSLLTAYCLPLTMHDLTYHLSLYYGLGGLPPARAVE